MKQKLSIVCAVILWATAAISDTPKTYDRLATAYQLWLDEQSANGALAVLWKGKPVFSSNHGLDPSQPVALASLSKSITAVCADALVKTGVLAWDDTFSAIVGRGPRVTLAQLVTHTAGFGRDGTQRLMRQNLDTQGLHISDQVLGRLRDGGDVGTYRYSNDHYALIALMIEAATGRAYKSVCTEKALDPASKPAVPAARGGTFLPWGGWAMTVEDYATWHAYWFAPINDATDGPHAMVRNGIGYGLGTFFRKLDAGHTFWHFGAFCFPGGYNVGSYVVTLFGKVTIVAAYDACVNWDAMFALDRTLNAALVQDAQK